MTDSPQSEPEEREVERAPESDVPAAAPMPPPLSTRWRVGSLRECREAEKTNVKMGLGALALSVLSFLPVPFNPIPLMGPPAMLLGLLSLTGAVYLSTLRRFALQRSSAIALISANDNKFTKRILVEKLLISPARAKAIIASLRKENMILVDRDSVQDLESFSVVYRLLK